MDTTISLRDLVAATPVALSLLFLAARVGGLTKTLEHVVQAIKEEKDERRNEIASERAERQSADTRLDERVRALEIQ